jgi:starch synthase
MGVTQPRLDRPVIGIVSRFATQKGFDLIAGAAEELMAMDVYVVALGTGEPAYEDLFRKLAEKFPQSFLVKIEYDNTLAHQIEAGSDLFLMPSRYEPCGLNQMYSMKYGSVTVVRATGGLDDSVEAFDGKSGTGFKFSEYSAKALLATLRQAIQTYHHTKLWQRLVDNCMRKDFSWTNSAKQYAKIYEALRNAKHKAAAQAVNV